MPKQQPDTAATLTAANDTLLRIIAAHRETGQVPPDALPQVRETAAALKCAMANAGPTLAATIANLVNQFEQLERQLTAIK